MDIFPAGKIDPRDVFCKGSVLYDILEVFNNSCFHTGWSFLDGLAFFILLDSLQSWPISKFTRSLQRARAGIGDGDKACHSV